MIEHTPAVGSRPPLLGIDWPAIETAMGAVVGPRGVAAMLARSLELTTARHPWLADLKHEEPGLRAGEKLARLLGKQPPKESEAASAALMTAFRELAGRLIGHSLTDRVLAAAHRREPARARAFEAAQA